ncbi:sigma-54-dependent Fis family transcriptional regulator [Bacillus megaterium]|nr:sigma-54-dependent Fis family transcriptional regulator [Priestia megaterium]
MESTLSLNTWKRFVNEGALESSRLNDIIVKSWHRCKSADVNPYLDKGRSILRNEAFHSRKQMNSLFLETALPHLERIRQSAADLGMVALLIDPEGYILSITGNRLTLNEARKINFVEGACWTEKEVGTNAIGTALQTEEPIMITGTEHYSIASHQWSCSAAPVRNDEGNLIGIINISCPVNRAHPYTLGMVTSIAYTIERELSIRMHKDEIELVHASMNFVDSKQLLLLCNYKEVIVGASKTVRECIPKWSGLQLNTIVQQGFRIVMEVPVISKRHGHTIGKIIYLSEEAHHNQTTTQIPAQSFSFKGEAGISRSFQQTLEEIKHAAPTDTTVYILGETGTGKEVIAQTIHENSSRKNGPFIALNCGAIPKELMESELFGYVEGAFTGARRQGYQGKFEQANHGTIFLDEIGELPHSMQVSLLRVLQERKVTPVGSNQEIPVDIRIITATHRDLRQLVSEGKFREDLYYRLHVYPVHVPPLRERKEDIPHLMRYFCQKNAWNMNFSKELVDKLIDYQWPGNIRELFNVLERLKISLKTETEKERILNYLSSLNLGGQKSISHFDTSQEIEENDFTSLPALTFREKVQKDLMMDALRKTQGNVSLAAKLLDIPRSTFYNRLKRFNL